MGVIHPCADHVLVVSSVLSFSASRSTAQRGMRKLTVHGFFLSTLNNHIVFRCKLEVIV